MRSPLSLPRSSGPVRHDGWPNSMPPLADHTTAYLAQQMRRADEVAEAARVRRLAEAGTGSSPGGPVIGEDPTDRQGRTWCVSVTDCGVPGWAALGRNPGCRRCCGSSVAAPQRPRPRIG